MKTKKEIIIEVLDQVINNHGLFNEVKSLFKEFGITEIDYDEVMEEIENK